VFEHLSAVIGRAAVALDCEPLRSAIDHPLMPADLKAHACLHHKFPTSRKLERWPLRPEHAGIETELPRTAVASSSTLNNHKKISFVI
jgi:hypothetical protein